MSPFIENERRSVQSIERDRLVIRAILEHPATVDHLVKRFNLRRADVYGSVSRLQKREFVEKVSTKTRTPKWDATEAGRAYVAQLPDGQPALPVDPPEPEPPAVEQPATESVENTPEAPTPPVMVPVDSPPEFAPTA